MWSDLGNLAVAPPIDGGPVCGRWAEFRRSARALWSTVTACLTPDAISGGESGQGLVEYAIVGLLVSVAAVIIIGSIGQQVSPLFQGALNAL